VYKKTIDKYKVKKDTIKLQKSPQKFKEDFSQLSTHSLDRKGFLDSSSQSLVNHLENSSSSIVLQDF